jgi:xylulokinase
VVKTCDAVMVVDFGMSKVRALLIDIGNGSTLKQASSNNTWHHLSAGRVEINPEDIWVSSQRVVSDLLEGLDAKVSILGCSFSFFGDHVIPVDEKGKALYHLLPALDSRAIEEVHWLSKEIGEETFINITGGTLSPRCVGAKILWFKNNLRDVFDRARHFFDLQQYLLVKLGMPAMDDFSMASRKMLFDVSRRVWSESLLSVIGLQGEHLGAGVIESSSVLGKIGRYGEVKLPYEIPVVLGGHDSECGLLGLGVHCIGDNLLAEIMGTFDCIGVFTDRFINTCKIAPTLYAYCGLGREDFVVKSGFPAAGSLLEWFTSNLYRKTGEGVFDELFDSVQFDGTAQLFTLPRFDAAEGCIIGFDLSKGLQDIFRSNVEAISFEFRTAVEEFNRIFDNRFDRIRVGGGGSQSPKWLQLKADIAGKAVEKVGNIEVSALGAAMIAAIGLGVYRGFPEAISRMVVIGRTFLPNEEVSNRYSKRYDRYKRLKAVLKEVMVHG